MGSVILKNIFRFAFRRWDKIPNDELKGYSIYIFLVGIFALGWRKKKKNELAFLIIEWKKGKFENSTIFSFEGKEAFQNANTSRNKLISFYEELAKE